MTMTVKIDYTLRCDTPGCDYHPFGAVGIEAMVAALQIPRSKLFAALAIAAGWTCDKPLLINVPDDRDETNLLKWKCPRCSASPEERAASARGPIYGQEADLYADRLTALLALPQGALWETIVDAIGILVRPKVPPLPSDRTPIDTLRQRAYYYVENLTDHPDVIALVRELADALGARP